MPAVESKSAARQEFIYYLRTGRRLPETALNAVAAPLEAKFNPWHDPTNGRFNFAGAGRYFGGWTGGGGSFGGGGGKRQLNRGVYDLIRRFRLGREQSE
jgi:uncharacterized membrane protein YgcG